MQNPDATTEEPEPLNTPDPFNEEERIFFDAPKQAKPTRPPSAKEKHEARQAEREKRNKIIAGVVGGAVGLFVLMVLGKSFKHRKTRVTGSIPSHGRVYSMKDI